MNITEALLMVLGISLSIGGVCTLLAYVINKIINHSIKKGEMTYYDNPEIRIVHDSFRNEYYVEYRTKGDQIWRIWRDLSEAHSTRSIKSFSQAEKRVESLKTRLEKKQQEARKANLTYIDIKD